MDKIGIEGLVEAWGKIEIDEARVKARKKEIVSKILELVKPPEGGRGTVKLPGNEKQFSVTFKQNVSYSDKEKLAEIFTELPDEAGDLFRIELKEKTQAMEDYLKNSGNPHVEALKQIRQVKAGAPGVKVEVIKE